MEATQYDTMLGLFSEVLPFWNTRIDAVWVQIEPSAWIRNVLPGLGYDRLRLIEMAFPPPLPDHKSAAGQFDKARRALDEGRYGDSISACRGLLNMWETQLKATKDNRVAAVVADQRGWADDDIRRKLLDALWKQVGDLANAPHHPEGDVDSELFDARDARLILLLTASLSGYVQSR